MTCIHAINNQFHRTCDTKCLPQNNPSGVCIHDPARAAQASATVGSCQVCGTPVKAGAARCMSHHFVCVGATTKGMACYSVKCANGCVGQAGHTWAGGTAGQNVGTARAPARALCANCGAPDGFHLPMCPFLAAEAPPAKPRHIADDFDTIRIQMRAIKQQEGRL